MRKYFITAGTAVRNIAEIDTTTGNVVSTFSSGPQARCTIGGHPPVWMMCVPAGASTTQVGPGRKFIGTSAESR